MTHQSRESAELSNRADFTMIIAACRDRATSLQYFLTIQGLDDAQGLRPYHPRRNEGWREAVDSREAAGNQALKLALVT